MKINVEDLATAGLADEGVYRLEIGNLSETLRETGPNAKNPGTPYVNVEGSIKLVEVHEETKHHSPGLLDRPEYIYEKFSIMFNGETSKGAKRFTQLYKSATGKTATGELNHDTGQMEVDLQHLCDDLMGSDTVWGRYEHRPPWREGEEISGALGWTFSTDPNKIKGFR